MEENPRKSGALRRDKTIKVHSGSPLNASKENIKKAIVDNRYIKLELIPVDANGFEVSARQKILQYLKDGETFYFGRSKSLGITDTRISRNQLMIVANIPGGVSVKNTGMNYSRYARKQNREKTRILSKEEPVHLKNGDEIELFSNLEKFRLSIEIVNDVPPPVFAKEAPGKEKRSRSSSSNGNLSKSNSNIVTNSNDNNVNNNSSQVEASSASIASPRQRSTRNSALISPKRLNESDTKEKKPKRDHRHSLHEHRSMSPRLKVKEDHKKEKGIPEEKVKQIQEILPGVPRYKVLYALRACSGDVERATNYLLTRPNEQIPDEPMDASPRKEDLSSSPLTSPKRQDDSQLIILDDEDEDGNAEQAREEMEIDLYFSADGGKGKSDSDDEDSVHEEHDILPPDQTVNQEKVEVNLDDEKVLAGRYDNFLKSHSVPDDMYIDSQTVPQPVDMATQNVSELFTQLQQANAKVSELEKQVKTLTGGFGFEVFMKMKKAHGEAMKKKEKSECMICYEKKKKITTACGCKVMCKSCYNKLPKKICPNCNKPILYYNASS
jgi:hypothetical protein